MTLREYFDPQAQYWDDSFEYNPVARNAAALVSGAAHGSYILDVGCGTGGMFPALLQAGACEITGVDLSPEMLRVAAGKAGNDNRVTLFCMDICDLQDQRFDDAIAFDVWQYLPDPVTVIRKVHSLLREGGRFTVAFSFGREAVNAYSELDPEGISRKIGTVWDEARLFYDDFKVDILCDTPDLFIISGTAK